MRDDFAIFILSNGRADSVKSYDALINSGYTGNIKIIVDDLDGQVDEYISRYGNKVVVFDKLKVAKSVDTIINTNELRSVVYARNYAEQLAREMGLKYYAQFDDDVISLMYKYNEYGKLKSKRITCFDRVVDAILDFMDESDATSISICSTGSLIGGANGNYKNGIKWNFNQTVFIRTGRCKFRGIGNEDVNSLMLLSKFGNKMFEIYRIAHTCSKRGNSGGLAELYADFGLYSKRFMSIICAPGSCMLTPDGRISIISNSAFPKILGGKLKK